MAEETENIAEPRSQASSPPELGSNGAQFWVHISPQHGTEQRFQEWSVTFRLGDWTGIISSDNPQEILQTPGLSGIFDVTVSVSGPATPTATLTPLPDSRPQIGCNGNCAAMVGIIAGAGEAESHYWTVWDALCN